MSHKRTTTVLSPGIALAIAVAAGLTAPWNVQAQQASPDQAGPEFGLWSAESVKFAEATEQAVKGTALFSRENEYPAINAIGFFQQRFVYDSRAGSPATFFFRRARLGAAGSVSERISYNLTGGFLEAPDNNPQLVDAYVDFEITELATLRSGQFKVPFGLEGPASVRQNPAIERSTPVRRMNPHRTFRDIGVQLQGSGEQFNYAVGIINGAGANRLAQLDQKDVIGRLGVLPMEELQAGVSGHIGRYVAAGTGGQDFRRVRFGIDAHYEQEAFLIRSEYMVRSDERPAGVSRTQHGGYLLGGHQAGENWQPVARFEYHNPDTDAENDALTVFMAGVNYYLVGDTRVSANYEFRTDRSDAPSSHVFTVQLQLSF